MAENEQKRLVDKKPCKACKQEKKYTEFYKDDDEYCIQCQKIAEDGTRNRIDSAITDFRKKLRPEDYNDSYKYYEKNGNKYTEVSMKVVVKNTKVLVSNAGE